MTPPTLISRTALLAVLLAGTIALGACGRRGRPEAPPDPNAPRTEQSKSADRKSTKAASAFQSRPNPVGQDDDDEDDDTQPEAEQAAGVSQPALTSRKKRQPFVVPKDPFILDSIL